jgi:ligand-binding sensor domain-containing protein/signal transduction histidine kinase
MGGNLVRGLCVILTAFAWQAYAAVPEPRLEPQTVRVPVIEGTGLSFRRISTSDGLSQTRVSQILQGNRGFMWFATQYGLDRYDGYEFKVFVHDPLRPNSLAGAWISSLFKDRAGLLWIGSNQVLDRFDPATETFTHFRIESSESGGLGGTVVHISQDRAGMLWLATGSGLHRLDPTTGAILHYRHSLQDPDGLGTNDIKWTGEDRGGNLWVGSSEGLDEFDRTSGKVRLHIPIPDAVRIAFYEDKSGNFWITHATGSGLALYDRASNTVTRYSFYEQEPAADALTGVMGMVEDDSGSLWVGSPGLGLLEFDSAAHRFIHYRHNPTDPHSIGEDKVIALFKDREGNIWTGLHSVGPNHFSRRPLQFQTFKHQPDDPNSLDTDFINALYEDHHGTLWIGNDNGLNRIDRRTGKRTFSNAGLGSKPMVITLTEDPAGLIWFGTFAHGMSSYDPRTGKYQSYRHDPADPNSLSNDQVHRLFVDHTGRLWVGTDDGLDLFDSKTGSFHTYKVEPESRSSQRYVTIAEDEQGTLWLGSAESGLHHFDPATGKFTVYKADPNTVNGLLDDTVPTVRVSSSHMIWIGTINGLNRLDPATGRFSAYDVRNGLGGNPVSCILEDARGNLWLSTNKGISKLDPLKQTFANYSTIDGLPGEDLTGWSACHKSSSGEMFFGGYAGAVAFFPDQLRETPFLPPVVLSGFELRGMPVLVGPEGPLQRSMPYTSHLSLSHEQNIFTVKFVGLRFLSPETIHYRYRLEGLDPRWYETDNTRRQATYTTLPSGQYDFRVQAASGRGPWSEPGASLHIEVLPPWWATWWFRLLYGVLLAGAVWWAYRIRVSQVAHRVTIRMEERIAERTRIAQDLHDTLLQGLLSASLQLAVANSQLPAEAPSKPLVSRVYEMLRQLIEEGRNTVLGLRIRHLEPDELERAISLIPRDLGVDEKHGFKLTVEGTPRLLRPAVRDEVYWIAREALANAFRHSGARVIEVVLEYSRNRFRMLIRDNGCGMDADVVRSGREGHWGLVGMNERSERIAARLSVLSALGAGTEIDLVIPSQVAFEPGAVRD